VDSDDRALTGKFFRSDTVPKWKIVDTVAGFVAGSARAVGEGNLYWRLNQFMLPFYTMIPQRESEAMLTRVWVPMDDHNCWVFCINYRVGEPINEAELAAWKNGDVNHRKVIPGTTTPTERQENDYLIDRHAQKTISFTGIAGIRAQDAMVTESAGSIVDRSREHLGSSDRAVVTMRKRLMHEARAHAETGVSPMPSIRPQSYALRATQCVLPDGADPEQAAELKDSFDTQAMCPADLGASSEKAPI
jgi:hypothetical protein